MKWSSILTVAIATTALGSAPAWNSVMGYGPELSMRERLALERVRQVYFAQERFRNLAAVDVDSDGIGEYATLAELASTVPLRNSTQTLEEKFGTDPFSRDLGWIDVNGFATADGYYFAAFLPDWAGAPQPEKPFGGINVGALDPNVAEIAWAVYAWPQRTMPDLDPRTADVEKTFLINNQGVVTMAENAYHGASFHPEGLSGYFIGVDMTGSIVLNPSDPAWDGFPWSPVDGP